MLAPRRAQIRPPRKMIKDPAAQSQGRLTLDRTCSILNGYIWWLTWADVDTWTRITALPPHPDQRKSTLRHGRSKPRGPEPPATGPPAGPPSYPDCKITNRSAVQPPS